MFERLSSVVLVFCGLSYGCSCAEPSVEAKKNSSELVFRGTITELRDSMAPAAVPPQLIRDTKKIAVFRVTRVWKGEVGPVFDMPAVEETTACTGFWPPLLKVGSDLLVYARRLTADYVTSICGFHKLAEDAADLKELGPGDEPKPPKAPRNKKRR